MRYLYFFLCILWPCTCVYSLDDTECHYFRKNSPIEKIGASFEVQCKIDYAYHISKDIDFVLTCNSENNQTWDENIKSPTNDFGICQINAYYHSWIVNSPEYKNWKYQINMGWELYRIGTTFYADPNKFRHYFKIKKI